MKHMPVKKCVFFHNFVAYKIDNIAKNQIF